VVKFTKPTFCPKGVKRPRGNIVVDWGAMCFLDIGAPTVVGKLASNYFLGFTFVRNSGGRTKIACLLPNIP